MTSISFARHQFPPDVIRHAVWLYLRFTLSLRDVEEMLAERGLDLTYETVRLRVTKFGPLFARELRKRRQRPTGRWHLDEMVVKIAGKRHWLWRAVDDEGEVRRRARNGAAPACEGADAVRDYVGVPVSDQDSVNVDLELVGDELRNGGRGALAVWRTIAVHYAAIADYLKAEGLDLLGQHRDDLTPEFRAMLEEARPLPP